jgi:hypothetical protein
MFQKVLLAAALQRWDVPSPHACAAREVAIQLAKGSSHPLAVLTVYIFAVLPLVQPPLVRPEVVAERKQLLLAEEAALYAGVAAKLRDYVEAIARAGVAVMPLMRLSGTARAVMKAVHVYALINSSRSTHNRTRSSTTPAICDGSA